MSTAPSLSGTLNLVEMITHFRYEMATLSNITEYVNWTKADSLLRDEQLSELCKNWSITTVGMLMAFVLIFENHAFRYVQDGWGLNPLLLG